MPGASETTAPCAVTLERLAAQQGSELREGEREALLTLVDLQRQMGDRLLENFAHSIAAFRRHIPSIAEAFEHYRPQESLEFFCSHNSQPNLYLSGRKRILYPSHAPIDLCRDQVESLLSEQMFKQVNYDHEPDPYGQIHVRYMNEAITALRAQIGEDARPRQINSSAPILIMLGCGLGYQIAELYSRIEIGNLIIIEPDLDIFYASLFAFDWEGILDYIKGEGNSIFIMLGQSPDQLFFDLNAFYRRHGPFLAGYAWTYVHYQSPQVEALGKVLLRDYSSIYAGMGFFDDHLFAVSHACRHILEGREFVRGDTELPGEWLSTPLLVVGNGPSLDH
nr:hypothetical protein [Succinivibrionaceae bacterium]